MAEGPLQMRPQREGRHLAGAPQPMTVRADLSSPPHTPGDWALGACGLSSLATQSPAMSWARSQQVPGPPSSPDAASSSVLSAVGAGARCSDCCSPPKKQGCLSLAGISTPKGQMVLHLPSFISSLNLSECRPPVHYISEEIFY